jgi:hypothetical protein
MLILLVENQNILIFGLALIKKLVAFKREALTWP